MKPLKISKKPAAVKKPRSNTGFSKLKVSEAREMCEELGYNTEGASLLAMQKTLYAHHDIEWYAI